MATFQRSLNYIGPRVKEKIAFKANYSRFSIFSSGSHFIHRCETISAVLLDGYLSNNPMKFK